MSNRMGNCESYIFGQVKNMIGRGSIQVPEFMSKQFSWNEDDIINYLDHFYSGTYRTNILLVDAKMRFMGTSNFSSVFAPTLIIPSRRLSRNVSAAGVKFLDNQSVDRCYPLYYILDGFHRLQSLYLAWHGLLNGKRAYFDICALDAERFSFLKPANINPIRHVLLGRVRGISVPDLAFIDQVNVNCQRFREVFHQSRRISFDVIDLDDPFFERYVAKNDKSIDLQTVADRMRFIRESYVNPDGSKKNTNP